MPIGATNVQRDVYRAGTGKRALLALTFLLLLPFFVSLGPMLYQRLSHGLIGDAAGFGVFALAFTALMALIAGQLVHSIRSRVELGERSVSMVLPKVQRGLPMPTFRTIEIPYDQVQQVETRSEVYASRLLPTVLKSTRITTRDGNRLVLGLVNEHNVDQAFPFPEIGGKIAARAGIVVADRGMVRRSIPGRLLGSTAAPADNVPLTETEIAGITRRHRRNGWLLVALLAALTIAGIGYDWLEANPTTFASLRDIVGIGSARPPGR